MRTDEEFKREVLYRADKYKRKRAARLKAVAISLSMAVICVGAVEVVLTSGTVGSDKSEGSPNMYESFYTDNKADTEEYVYKKPNGNKPPENDTDGMSSKSSDYVYIKSENSTVYKYDDEYVKKLDSAFKEALSAQGTQASPPDGNFSQSENESSYTVRIQLNGEKTTYRFNGKTLVVNGEEKITVSEKVFEKLISLIKE